MSLLTELKRRNVIRVAVAYVVAAWLLLQITDVLMSVLGLPEVVGKAVFLLLVIGFVPAVVFSWAYELTPEGLKRDAEVHPGASAVHHTARKLDAAVIVMLLAVGALVVWDRLVPKAPDVTATEVAEEAPNEAPDADSAEDAVVAPAAGGQTSIAVLPFANMSPDPDNEYFADGISEELLNVLVDIEGLRVPSRTSSFAFKGQNRDIRDIARQLQVDHVLEGSVRKAGNQVRITAQLIDVSTDAHLWSETYDRELADIFAIQDEIAGHIVDALKLALAIEDSRPPTSDIEAYTLYLQARELLRQRDPEGLLQADRMFGEVTARDPDFADAWARRAMVQIVLPGYVKDDYENFREPARRYAEQALALDPGNPEAGLVLGQVLGVTDEEARALDQFATLVAEHPQHSTARLWYAIALANAGYLEEAYQQINAGLKVDPVHGTILDWYGRIAHSAGHPERVVEIATRAIQLGRPQGRVALHHAFIVDGSAEDMAPFIEGPARAAWGWMLKAYPLREDPALLGETLAWVDEAEAAGAGFISEYMRAEFLMLAGESTAFFDKLNTIRAVDDTADSLAWIKAAERHRGSSAFKDWVRQRGYYALWRERGWPDLCRPVGDDDFECDG